MSLFQLTNPQHLFFLFCSLCVDRQLTSNLQGFDFELPSSVNSIAYASSIANSVISYPLSSVLSYTQFSPSHQSSLAAITSLDEPSTFSSTIKDPRLQQAMQFEIAALKTNGT